MMRANKIIELIPSNTIRRSSKLNSVYSRSVSYSATLRSSSFLNKPTNSQQSFARRSLSQVYFTPIRGFGSEKHHEAEKKESDLLQFTRAEVATHNTLEDCWIIIHNKVYNVTKWIEFHPGGIVIVQRAGHDSTDLFESSGHTPYAREMLNDFLIGEITDPIPPRGKPLPRYD